MDPNYDRPHDQLCGLEDLYQLTGGCWGTMHIGKGRIPS
jgi:hypothetical protein